jgi:hypothetical protein
MKDQEGVSGDEARFMQLIAMFQLAAMQQMGKLVSPVTGEAERDLEHAKTSIDMLETIQRRTDGNRTDGESELLKKVLFELRMNYVDETRPAESAESEPEAGTAGEEEEPAEDAESGGGADKASDGEGPDSGGSS